MRKLRAGKFFRDESGTMSMEAALWFPVILAVFIFVADAAVLFMNNARIQRIVEDGNRAFAVGQIHSCPELIEWLHTNIRPIAPSAQAGCDSTSVVGIGIARVTIPSSELDLSGATGFLKDMQIRIQTQYLLEDV